MRPSQHEKTVGFRVCEDRDWACGVLLVIT